MEYPGGHSPPSSFQGQHVQLKPTSYSPSQTQPGRPHRSSVSLGMRNRQSSSFTPSPSPPPGHGNHDPVRSAPPQRAFTKQVPCESQQIAPDHDDDHDEEMTREQIESRKGSGHWSPSVRMRTDRYSCSECYKSFSRPSSLRIHRHSHTGERPFVCATKGCGRAFSVRSNMRRHMRVHGF